MIILTINFNFVNPLIKNAKLLLYLFSTYTILLFCILANKILLKRKN